MSRLWRITGRALFWLTYPGLWLILRNTQRTRLVIMNEMAEMLVVKGWLGGSGKWGLPGGGLHRGEAAIAGALRELAEETGLRLPFGAVRVLTTRPYRRHGITTRLIYLTGTVTGRPPLRPQRGEILEAAWVPVAALTTRTAEPDVLLPLQRWLESADFATM